MIENEFNFNEVGYRRETPDQILRLTSSFTITQLQSSLANHGITPEYFYTLVGQERFMQNARDRLLENSGLPFTAALSLARASFHDLSHSDSNDFILPYEPNALVVDLFSKEWRNCTESEALMRHSLQRGSIVGVNNGRLAVKGDGLLTALCIDTFATDTSTFVKGVWYSPIEVEMRDKLEDALGAEEQFAQIENGSWIPIRGAYTADNLIENIRIAMGFEPITDYE